MIVTNLAVTMSGRYDKRRFGRVLRAKVAISGKDPVARISPGRRGGITSNA
jgi:hypothetical protein